MEKATPPQYPFCDISVPLPETAVFIIGAGHFGQRALRILSERGESPIFIVDKEKSNLEVIQGGSAKKILCDGIHFLCKNFLLLHPSNTVIPAIPLHLTFEWLKGLLEDKRTVHQAPVPEKIRSILPHTWQGSEGSLLVSYADFRCPDDCPEPEEYCTVTGKRRGPPLYDLLGGLAVAGYRVHVTQSRQIAPGMGGYRVRDMARFFSEVKKSGNGRWLLGTACKCHGIITAFEIRKAAPLSP